MLSKIAPGSATAEVSLLEFFDKCTNNDKPIFKFQEPMKPTNILCSFFFFFILNAHAGWEEEVKKLSELNPGSLTLLLNLQQEFHTKGCPDGCFESVLSVLKENRIYGERIWMLFKDVCKEDESKFYTIINAITLGFVTSDQISVAIENHGQGIDFSAVEQAVLPVLPHIHTVTYFFTGAHK